MLIIRDLFIDWFFWTSKKPQSEHKEMKYVRYVSDVCKEGGDQPNSNDDEFISISVINKLQCHNMLVYPNAVS